MMTFLKLLDLIVEFIVGMIRLALWFSMAPFLIVCWCFYHPAQAKIYFMSAIPLLWEGGWGTRWVLILFAVLILTLFKRKAWMIILISLVFCLGWYIYAIFKMA